MEWFLWMSCFLYKTSFVFLLLSVTILSISNGPLTIVEFIDWVGCK